MRRIVPRPEVVRSAHAVFTAAPIGAPADLPAPPRDLLAHYGTPEADLDRLEARPHATVLITDASTDSAAEALVATRTQALDLAAEHDGVVVDLAVPRVVAPSEHATDLAVSSAWVAADLDPGAIRTRGLEAFGLPELRLPVESPDQTAVVAAAMTGLAHRLVAEWPQQDPVGPAAVTLRDVAHGYGDAEADTAPVESALDLMLTYDEAENELAVTFLDDPAVLFD